MTVTMRSLTVIAIISLLANLTVAQKECSNDTDCGSKEFCYVTNICAKYTNCTWYFRQEGAKPARSVDQCGPCLSGHTAEKTPKDTIDGGKEAPHCNKAPIVVPAESGRNVMTNVICGIGTIIVVAVASGLGIYWLQKKKNFRTCCSRNVDLEQPMNIRPLALANCAASAPPLDPIQNNNVYPNNPEEAAKLLQYKNPKVLDYNIPVAHDRPVTAQAFHPPDYIQRPIYNPQENSQDVAVSSPLENDEETIASTWTPGESNTVPENPFAAINAEQQNIANNAVAGACPSPSTSTDGRGNRQGNGSAGNSNRFNESSAQGNGIIIQIAQYTNIIDHSGNGS